MSPKKKQEHEGLSRVCVFAGNDAIGRERAREELFRKIGELHGSIEEDKFDSSAEPISDFLTRAITPSLFGLVRVFQVKHANQLSQEECKELERVVKYELPDVYIVIDFDESAGKKSKGAALLKALGGHAKSSPDACRVFEFAKPPDYKIPEWLTQQVPALFNRKISKESAEHLVDCVGNELETLYSELQKIDIHLPPKAPIDKTAIESVTGATRSMSSFELARAAGAKDFGRVLEIIESLFASEFYVPLCISALFRHFWGLFRIRVFAQSNRDVINEFLNKSTSYNVQTEIAHKIGVAAGLLGPNDPVKKAYPVIILSGIVNQARGFKDHELKKILGWLKDYDVGCKTGRIDSSKHGFQLLCFKIVRVSENSV